MNGEGEQTEKETKQEGHPECICDALRHHCHDEHGDLRMVYHDGFPDGAGIENDSGGNWGIGVKGWE